MTVKPVRRSFAKLIDISVVSATLVPIMYFAGIREFTAGNLIIAQVCLTLSFFVYDIFCTFLFGRTAGKFLLNLQVTEHDDSRLTFVHAVIRSGLSLVMGLGLLIAPFTVIAVIISFVMTKKEKPLPWDRYAKVHAHDITGLRCTSSVLIVIAFIILVMLPVAIDQMKLVPYTGSLTEVEYKADYDVISEKYIKALEGSSRVVDKDYYSANKLYDSPDFAFIAGEDGEIKGFTYSLNIKYNQTFPAETQDTIVMGLLTMIASQRENRNTYNYSIKMFDPIFTSPFTGHVITNAGVTVIHEATEWGNGYHISYKVTFTEAGL
ncbi:MAG: RDD family protein [Clostridiales bacterium]|nr:RDD family protein [Clostridiales bacterium]